MNIKFIIGLFRRSFIMKILSISNVLLVAGLVLGLTAVWVSATPCQISGNQVEAGTNPCKEIAGKNCLKTTGEFCGFPYLGCVGDAGLDCWKPNETAAQCIHTGCVKKPMYFCD
jgi:hypothetical protein